MFFSCNFPAATGTLSSFLKIQFFAFVVKFYFASITLVPPNAFMRKRKDPVLDPDPYI
jgi:hypothetical protein